MVALSRFGYHRHVTACAGHNSGKNVKAVIIKRVAHSFDDKDFGAFLG